MDGEDELLGPTCNHSGSLRADLLDFARGCGRRNCVKSVTMQVHNDEINAKPTCVALKLLSDFQYVSHATVCLGLLTLGGSRLRQNCSGVAKNRHVAKETREKNASGRDTFGHERKKSLTPRNALAKKRERNSEMSRDEVSREERKKLEMSEASARPPSMFVLAWLLLFFSLSAPRENPTKCQSYCKLRISPRKS